MAVFNSLQFDDINSLDYGIYITGEAVYNSPERDVEVVSVPGRNGDILIDNGRYNNIEVTYRAGCFGANQDEFAQKIKAFRAVLASKKGYQRITDTYNPNEYRMGTFIQPIEVSKESYDRVGEFDIIFNCKPQRFLTSGETEISVARNANINNPTPFDAKPMVMVHGYGTINIGDYVIELDDGFIGKVTILDGRYEDNPTDRSVYVQTLTKTFNYSEYADIVNVGDDLSIDLVNQYGWVKLNSDSIFIISENGTSISPQGGRGVYATISNASLHAFPSSAETVTQTATKTFGLSNSTSFNLTSTLTVKNKPSGEIEITCEVVMGEGAPSTARAYIMWLVCENIYIDSTFSSIGDPTYIDCDIGEAYLIDANDNIVSLNALIELGSDLPVLSPGNTQITYDNTISAVEIIPRWWIL